MRARGFENEVNLAASGTLHAAPDRRQLMLAGVAAGAAHASICLKNRRDKMGIPLLEQFLV
jgi:hypothetical protein